MKKKALAILLSLLMLTSVTLPGTWATEETEISSEAESEAGDVIIISEENTTQDDSDNEETPAESSADEGNIEADDTTEPSNSEDEANDPSEEETPDEDVEEDKTESENRDEIIGSVDDDEIEDEIIDGEEEINEELEEEIITETVTVMGVVGDCAPMFTSTGPLIEYEDYSLMTMDLFGWDTMDLNDDEQTTSGLKLNKTADYDSESNECTIALEAYATGESVTSYVKDGVDIVLMLDLSNYMYKYEKSDTYTSVSSSTTLDSLYNSGTKYYYKSREKYYEVTIIREIKGEEPDQKITYVYNIKYNTNNTIVNEKNGSTTLSSVDVTLYTKTTNTTYDNTYTDKLNALKSAVNAFIEKVHEQAPASRIAIVTYAENASVVSGNKTETDGALVTMNDEGVKTLKNIVNKLNILGGASNSHNAAADAVKIFQSVSTTSVEYSRQRVSILFSAGVPGTGWTTNDGKTGGKDIAQATMHLANILKTSKGNIVNLSVDSNFDGGKRWNENEVKGLLTNSESDLYGCGSNFYCVGLDLPSSGDPRENEVRLWEDPWKEGALVNEYFWRISNHRPDGSHIISASELGSEGESWLIQGVYNTEYKYHTSLYYFYPDGLTRNQGNGYYLTTTSGSTEDLKKLDSIFESIAGHIETDNTTSTTLNSNTVIRDIISPQFQLPKDADVSSIILETYAFTGVSNGVYTFAAQKNSVKLGATATIDGDKVNVTGFDFASNWCGTETTNGSTVYHGNKLVIKFTVQTKDGFLGGNDVFTNTSAGVYEDADATEPVQEFPRPTVNVPIQPVTVTATDKNVYLLGNLTAEQIKEGATVKCGNVDLDLGAENYGLDSWQTEYVDITVTYTDASGNTITNLNDLKEDKTYTITATVSPKTDGSSTDQGTVAETKSGNVNGKINVFKPELTFKDSKVYYGDTAPTSYDDNKTSEVWKHGETVSTAVTMIGDKPTLDLTYAPKGDKIVDGKINTKQDIPVDVTVKISGTDVTEKTTFVHTKCNDSEKEPANGKFWLHVKTCTLTIEKKAATGTTIGDDEYFVFNVKKDGTDYTQVTIQGTGSVELKELPVGNYTITEDASTAWRYYSTISGSGNLSSTNPDATFTCTNTKSNEHWLNHFARVINTFDKAN